MGLLSGATTLPWAELKKSNESIKRHGIDQFLRVHERYQDLQMAGFTWGDEVEYTLLKLNHEEKVAQVSLKQTEVLSSIKNKPDPATDWRPEYAAYMIEGVPREPYEDNMEDLCKVQENMKQRRQQLRGILSHYGDTVATISVYPRLGCPSFSHPSYRTSWEQNQLSRSIFYPDQVVSTYNAKYHGTTRNMRERKGSKVSINVPIFKDVKTPDPFTEEFYNDHNEECTQAAIPDHIHMDTPGFGVGCSCLQVTMQPRNLDEARYIYDQLTALAPIMMCLAAGSPIYRGYLADVDCRWSVLEQAHDDRTAEEKGEKPLKRNRFVIPKSRFGTVGCYVSNSAEVYNDPDLVYDEDIYDQIRNAGVDELLAQHIAHIFIRDAINMTREDLVPRDQNDLHQFEGIYYSVWQTVRLKVPSSDGQIGWRVEFRAADVQLTDFENTVYALFVVLLCKALLHHKIDLRIPICLVDENAELAQKRDSILTETFHFPRHMEEGETMKIEDDVQDAYQRLTVNEIVNGKKGCFEGLLPLIDQYMKSVEMKPDTRDTIHRYLQTIKNRATGEVSTTARWIRDFVRSHTEYRQDSVVTDQINYDLMMACDRLQRDQDKEGCRLQKDQHIEG